MTKWKTSSVLCAGQEISEKHKNYTQNSKSTSTPTFRDIKRNALKSCANENSLQIIGESTAEFIQKRCLKKCRFCGYKKRSCAKNTLSCKAHDKRCFICKRQGHFPKSTKCNIRKRRLVADKQPEIVLDEEFIGSNPHKNQNDSCVSSRDLLIPQFDGGNDECIDKMSLKKVYAVNCEIDEISVVANFLRSCHFLWRLSYNHELCEYNAKHKEMNCFLCNVRSSCLRLSEERKKGPKSLKLYEFVFQIFRIDKLGWNWRFQRHEVEMFIVNILKLLKREENSISQAFSQLIGTCTQCDKRSIIKSKYLHQVN